MDLHALQPGTTLDEYRIEKLLGEGGFGLTYLAFDKHLDKQVAIKEYMPSDFAVRLDGTTILPKSEGSKADYEWGLQAFINEAKTLAKFDDINIVRVYRFFEANGTAYLVMEFCEGGCLSDRFSTEKPMTEAAVRDFLAPIMNGLQLVHDGGVLHRDIKPDNIMFRTDGTPILIDFGAARQAIGAKSRSITTIITPGYAPLEQYSAKGNVGPWSDIYSLAAVAYACLTGEHPSDATNRVLDEDIKPLVSLLGSSNFLKAINLALAVHVKDRPQTLTDWYESWGEAEESVQADYSQLDGMIEMAGADKIITSIEMTMLLNKARQLKLDIAKSQNYIALEAYRQGWELELELEQTKNTQRGKDITQVVNINKALALTGGVLLVTLSGKKFEIKIPKKSKDGRKLKLHNLGDEGPGGRGDAFIVLNHVDSDTHFNRSTYTQGTKSLWLNKLQQVLAGTSDQKALEVPLKMPLREQADIRLQVRGARGYNVRLLSPPVAASLALTTDKFSSFGYDFDQYEFIFVAGTNGDYIDYAFVEICMVDSELQIDVLSVGSILTHDLTLESFHSLTIDAWFESPELAFIYGNQIVQLDEIAKQSNLQRIYWPSMWGNAVDTGLQIQDEILKGEICDVLLLDILPHQLDVYLRTKGEEIKPCRILNLIDASVAIPTKKTLEFEIYSSVLMNGVLCELTESTTIKNSEPQLEMVTSLWLQVDKKYLKSDKYLIEIQVDVGFCKEIEFKIECKELKINIDNK